jgi:menaquinone-9 beta-reductase
MLSDTKRTYDCAVIGGGPAGASAAFHLARLGYAVVLFEQTEGPTHKICGEFLSAETVFFLQEMGIDLDRAGGASISELEILSQRSSSRILLPSAARGVSRYWLDEVILEKAQEAGACIVRGCRVTDFQRSPNGFLIKTPGDDFYARSVFLATGKYDLRNHDLRKISRSDFIGFKMHIQLPDSALKEVGRRIWLYQYPGGYGGLTPIENGQVNLCCLLRQKIYRSLQQRRTGILEYVCRANGKLGALLKGMTLTSPVKTIANVPYGHYYPDFLKKSNTRRDDRVYVLGDQFAVIPSLTGSGIGIALMTGKMNAHLFDQQEHGKNSVLFGQWVRRTREQMKWAGISQNILIDPVLAETAVWTGKFFPGLLTRLFLKTRTPFFAPRYEKASRYEYNYCRY